MSEHKAPEWAEKAVHLYESGYNLNQTAMRVGKSPSTVYNKLQRAGVTLRSREEGIRLRQGGLYWVEEAIKLYQSGYSLSQIALRTGKGCETVRYQLQHAEVKLRSKKEGNRLRTWQDNGTLGLSFEPSATTLSLIGFGVGDGHLNKSGRKLEYSMRPTIVRNYVARLLRGLGLKLGIVQLPYGNWKVYACDIRWVEFNEPFFTDYAYLYNYTLKWPAAFVYGFFAAEGSHFVCPNGSIQTSFSNTDVRLLNIAAECLNILGYETTLGSLRKDGARELRLRGPSLDKAKFVINSPWPNKRVPSNYLVRRSIVNSELRLLYDRVLQELYTTYGERRVNEELLPAKFTGKSHNKRKAVPI